MNETSGFPARPRAPTPEIPDVYSVGTYLKLPVFVLVIALTTAARLETTDPTSSLYCLISGCVLSAVVGPVLFVWDQIKLHRYKREHPDYPLNLWSRYIVFIGLYALGLYAIVCIAVAMYHLVGQP